MKTAVYSLQFNSKGNPETVTMMYGYSSNSRKWEFKTPTITMLVPCHGKDQGHSVAKIIAGSFKRSGNVDGLARNNINKIVAPTSQEE